MIELRNEIMLKYLRRGLSLAYGDTKPLQNGSMRTLIHDEIVDGKTYRVIYVFDDRENRGVPYVIVNMKESVNMMDDWTHFLAKSVDL